MQYNPKPVQESFTGNIRISRKCLWYWRTNCSLLVEITRNLCYIDTWHNSARDRHTLYELTASTHGVIESSNATRWNTGTPLTKRLWFSYVLTVGLLQILVALNLQGVLNHQKSKHCDFISHCTVAATSIVLVEWKCNNIQWLKNRLVSCPVQVNSVVTSMSVSVYDKQLMKVTFTTTECGNWNEHALSPHTGTERAVPVHRMKGLQRDGSTHFNPSTGWR